MNGFVPTERSKLRRLYQRGSYDRAAVFAILDASGARGELGHSPPHDDGGAGGYGAWYAGPWK